jgi:hypothetical protein
MPNSRRHSIALKEVPKSQWNDTSQLGPATDGRYGSGTEVAGTFFYTRKADVVTLIRLKHLRFRLL